MDLDINSKVLNIGFENISDMFFFMSDSRNRMIHWAYKLISGVHIKYVKFDTLEVV